MRDLVDVLRTSLQQGRQLAYCRLVETRGSTPQKAGATMLVFADGAQAGTLGGGCVEAEVKRRALEAIAQGTAAIASFELDHDYGWDDGLICGGRMRILIQPLSTAACRTYLAALCNLLDRGAPLVEVVSSKSAAGDAQEPCLWLVDSEGQLVAQLGASADAGNEWGEIRQGAAEVMQLGRARTVRGWAYLPLRRRCRLVIVGGGHVGRAVAELAVDLDFDVWVVDDRQEYVEPVRFPRAERRIAGDIDRVLPELEITPDTYCLIVTRGHQHDQRALYYLAERGARYVGLIGSRRKIKLIFEDLLLEGIAAESLARVFAPVGVDIGSQTVPEIAVSICAELVAHRNCGGQVPGRPPPVPLRPGDL